MSRSIALVSASLFLALTANAQQCLNPGAPGAIIGSADDTVFTPHYPLGFSFPMANSALGNYTHFQVSTNGWLILTDGVNAGTSVPTGTDYGSDALLAGTAAGASPRIAPYWRDVNMIAPQAVFFDNASAPGFSCKIMWRNAVDYGQTVQKSFQAELVVTGEVFFSHTAGFNVQGPSNAWVGLSCGNGQAVPAQSDLSAGAVTSGAGVCFQQFATGTFDLGGKLLQFVPDGVGGWVQLMLGDCAYHSKYGTGCYDYSSPTGSFYQIFPSSAAASAALQGNAMIMTKSGTNYQVSWIPGGSALYVPPTGGATALPLGDDSNDTITLSTPFPAPGGDATQMNIMHNGVVTLGGGANNAGDYTPSGAEMATATNAAFYNWFDFNNAEAGSGAIKWEEVGSMVYVTFENVEGYDFPAVTNQHTVQFQFDRSNGNATIVWQTINTNSTAGREWFVGYTDAGVSTNPGSINLATTLPIVVETSLQQLALSASPGPIYTVGGPSVPITYTVNNIVDVVPPFGIGITLLIFSVAPIPGGLDMGFIGMPNCNLNIASLDVILTMPGSSAPTDSIVLTIPQPLSPGLSFYSQALSLFTPNTLPNGQNTFGGVLSNGLQSTFNLF